MLGSGYDPRHRQITEHAMDIKPPPQVTHADVCVAHGDGIGPEIMRAVIDILNAAGARLNLHPIEVGEQVYRAGHSSGIAPGAWDTLRAAKVMLKAPITTPQGGGYKSLNVTIRKTLGLYANVRPVVTYDPFVDTRHPGMDLVIIRENEEDLYAGIEHRQTAEVYQCLKLMSRPGCERIARYAFDYARANGRKKVSCFTKDNIMKLTDGLFHKVFDEVARDYPEIATEHLIVDIGTARIADDPSRFDVLLLPNLYGDIISDVAAELSGSVGLAGSANIGEHVAMFEAVHGSAPDIAGRDIANPSALLNAAVMMLVHVGQRDVAERVRNAWLRTIEDGCHTADIVSTGTVMKCGTRQFAHEVITRLGMLPQQLPPARFAGSLPRVRPPIKREITKTTVGVDVFVHEDNRDPEALAAQLSRITGDAFSLSMITNRGVKVWPGGFPETFCTDHWRARFTAKAGTVKHTEIAALLGRAADAGMDFIKTENLCNFDGEPGYSLGQGQ